jgi:dTDP-4-amino-4,6-dideoxygalactose transaminase
MASFETEFADYHGAAIEAVALNSATSGLHLAIEALNLTAGDEVIVPTWTFTATAEVVQYVGATPVIVDIEPDTLNLSLGSVEAALTPRTRAIIPVHFAGLPLDTRALRALVGDRIHIVEDAAHAMPSIGPDEQVGACSFSDACVFSFYATKTLTTGEGGMLTTRDADIAARARVMRLHGIDRDAFDRYTATGASWFYDVIAAGFKYNMSDVAAAMGRVQLRRTDEMLKRRTLIAQAYYAAFQDLDVQLPVDAPQGQQHAWHLFVVRLPESGVERATFIQRMHDRGVATSVHFIPLHEHTHWKGLVSDPQTSLPNAVANSQRAVSLPLSSRLTDSQVEQVIEAVVASTR